MGWNIRRTKYPHTTLLSVKLWEFQTQTLLSWFPALSWMRSVFFAFLFITIFWSSEIGTETLLGKVLICFNWVFLACHVIIWMVAIISAFQLMKFKRIFWLYYPQGYLIKKLAEICLYVDTMKMISLWDNFSNDALMTKWGSMEMIFVICVPEK